MTLYLLVSGIILMIIGIWWNPKSNLGHFINGFCFGFGLYLVLLYYIN
jgi:hypothetical protein